VKNAKRGTILYYIEEVISSFISGHGARGWVKLKFLCIFKYFVGILTDAFTSNDIVLVEILYIINQLIINAI
jgi:hypothetical protein